MAQNLWTKEETIIAFNVYCKIPFKSSSKTNPLVIKYAKILGRSSSALNMKIGNFGRLDPELKKQGITGLVNGSKLEEEVWNEFNGNWDKLAFQSEKLLAKFQNKKVEEIEMNSFPEGRENFASTKVRVNQNFFRNMILSSYNMKCCITGLCFTELLVASHIKPWSVDKKNRTNPHNGLCLNYLHDKAFDRGFITITPDYKIKISRYLNEYDEDSAASQLFKKYDKKEILKPERFLPKKEFLEYHYEHIFRK